MEHEKNKQISHAELLTRMTDECTDHNFLFAAYQNS